MCTYQSQYAGLNNANTIVLFQCIFLKIQIKKRIFGTFTLVGRTAYTVNNITVPRGKNHFII
jgi:hypothetical protein